MTGTARWLVLGRAFALVLPLFAIVGCGAQSPSSPNLPASQAEVETWFVEGARDAGLVFEHVAAPQTRFDFPEIMGGGVGLLDFDGDGDLDVYCVQSGDVRSPGAPAAANRLFSNRGDGTFEDVTERAGVGDTGYGMGCACGDVDNDGDVDLYVTNLGPNVLYRNRGDGTFEDVTAGAGVGDARWGTSATFFDLDGDGWLDLAIANYLDWTEDIERACYAPSGERDYCPPSRYERPARNTLYRNRGDGTFEDATGGTALARTLGSSLGVAAADFDGDGRCDLFFANDLDPNTLWLQSSGGVLAEQALRVGCAFTGTGFAGSGMGVHAFDVENDGDLDQFVTQLRRQGHVLYRYGDGRFSDVTSASGLFTSSLPYTGFGAGFGDFDNDGDADLFVTNGRVSIEEPIHDARRLYAEPDSLWEQGSDGRFALTPVGTIDAPINVGRAAAFGDLDNDGDLDIVVADLGGAVQLLRNVRADGRAWLQLRVVDGHGRAAIGARVTIDVAGALQHRWVQRGYSYNASNDPRVHFGLADADRAERVLVRWLDGSETDFGPLDANRIHELRAP